MKWFRRSKKNETVKNNKTAVFKEGGVKVVKVVETPYKATGKDGVMIRRPEGDEHRERRHLCFGRFFDMRVATIVACSVNTLVRILFLASDLTFNFGRSVPTDYYSLMLSLVGLFGAVNFEHIPTGLSALGLLWILFAHIGIGTSIPGVIYDALIIYPTAVVTYEIYSGILSEETYSEFIAPEITEALSQTQGEAQTEV